MEKKSLSELELYLKTALAEKVKSTNISFGELNVVVSREEIVSVLLFLRDDSKCQFVSLIDISGVDYPGRAERFQVSYHLLSPYTNMRIRIKLYTDEHTAVPSVCEVYAGAEWYEREAYDMYGILFVGNPDLRRILTDYGFEGHPLRKDFPMTGFVECRYDDAMKRVVYEPVVLRQEMRDFDFLSPWECMPYPSIKTTKAAQNSGSDKEEA